ncbi:MAG: glycosyltransferase [Akkermansiaceae bacterium]|nr:glycosyltransferase [Akkermansiaceae bacterium]
MSTQNPRILYLTNHYPHGPTYGGQIRALNIARLLRQSGQLRVAVVANSDPDGESLARTRDEFDLAAAIRLRPQRISGTGQRLRHELDPWYPNTHGWRLDAKDAAQVRQLVSEHDLVWVHGLFTANHAGIRQCPHALLDIDDIFSRYYRSALRHSKSPKERLRNARHYFLWKRRETVLFERFRALAVCSEPDRDYLGGGENIHVIPNGYEPPRERADRRPADPPRIGFIGTLNYPPNAEGIDWFISEVWPVVKKAVPAARLRLVGDASSSASTARGPDIDRLGFVEDAEAEMASWHMSIVPVRVGGGTRVKIAEAFSRRCPVVSTTWGAFGYELSPGKELLLADDPRQFGKACISILNDPNLAQELAENAWEQYQRNWTWEAIRPRVDAAVESCLRRNRDCLIPT